MRRSAKKRIFPPPPYLAMPACGIDISDESVKFAELVATKKGIRLGRYGEREIPQGVIESGRIKDSEKLRHVLSSIREKEKLEHARFSLSEEQVYLFRLTLDKHVLGDIREGVELVLEEHIPIPAEGAVFDYEIVGEDEKTLTLQVSAMERNTVESYLEVFNQSGLVPVSAELEGEAIARAVVRKGDGDAHMIVDLGERRTGIFIVAHTAVAFASTLEFGGMTLTDMIRKSFNVSFDEAEKIKKEYGLQRNLENKEIFPVLLNGLSVLRDEISKHLLYWHTHKDEIGGQNPPIKKIILCGGNANIVGLADYLSVSLKTKTEVADVWANIASPFEGFVPEMELQESLSFATALGLALGDFYDD